MRRLGFVSVGRSDFGLILPVATAAAQLADAEIHVFVTGARPRTGDRAGIPEAAAVHSVDLHQTGDGPLEIGQAMGTGVAAFARAMAKVEPDLMVMLGDRYETLAAAVAAVPLNVPIAHIHGGELTQGAIDEQIRHAITKLAHLHFVAATAFGRRLEQMGEEPWRITVSGAPGLDRVRGFQPKTREQLASSLDIDPARPWLLVTLHPETLDVSGPARLVGETLAGLEHWPGVLIFTAPNADAGGSVIWEAIRRFSLNRPDCRMVEALGEDLYLSMLHHSAAMAGNSSSGLIEAPSFKLPVVDIGDRQTGRMHAANVIRCPAERAAVAEALVRATSSAFKASLQDLANPYGDGHAAGRIVTRLMSIELGRRLLTKRFVDWP